MSRLEVQFRYLTGLSGEIFGDVAAQLHGSWDSAGRRSSLWTVSNMVRGIAEDGCVCFTASVVLESDGQEMHWGVSFVFPDGKEVWAIPTEVKDRSSREQVRSFRISGPNQEERYYLTHCRRLGANKVYRSGKVVGHRFAVWAPSATNVEVVIGTIWDRKDPTRTPASISLPFPDIAGGYISDDGTGVHPGLGPFAMHRVGDGVWQSDILGSPEVSSCLEHKPYMYRITRDDGSVRYRTDLFSRCQIGYGSFDPKGGRFFDLLSELDGSVSCSVVIDPEKVTRYFREEPPYLPAPPPDLRVWPEIHFIGEDEFWNNEFPNGKPPSKVEDLIIYELHVGALGFGSPNPGTLQDAIRLLDHVVEAGANTVELLPMSEFGGSGENWGYATSHYFAIEYSGGGRDQYKFFVKEAHRRGLAVLIDVVYNHYAHDAERAEWMYDSGSDERNIYLWYEGRSSDYRNADGGYVENQSTAPAPRYHEEFVRKLFISSAVALMHEFHVDGFRVDQTTSIHSYNRLRADERREVGDANIFGGKLLRELSRTLRLLKPDVMLIAEDHSDWEEVTKPSDEGGIGFDARWYADFYHHLDGDTDKGMEYAKLLLSASRADGQALAIDYFAGALRASGSKKVVYSESHDEAGNSNGPFFDPESLDPKKQFTSHRSLVVAVCNAPLVDETRRYAEARCRFAYGVTVLSSGTPMFLFGEEVGAQLRFKYNAVLHNKEDLHGLRKSFGANLYQFYGDINRLRLKSTGLRSRNIDVFYIHNQNRILAFRRWDDSNEFLIVGSLRDAPFESGYSIPVPQAANGYWKEIFNSNALIYGGSNLGNAGAIIDASNGWLSIFIPANSVLVFQRMAEHW